MTKLKPLAAAAAVGVAALAVSGCYAFSGLTVSKTKVTPSKPSTVNVKAISASGPEDKDVFFLAIALPDADTAGDTSDDPFRVQNGKFDTGGVLYDRPKPLRPSGDLRDFIEVNGCGDDFDELADGTSRIVVIATENRVKQTGVNKQVNSRYVLKQVELNETVNPLGLVTAVGSWDDDGDGIPEPSGGIFDPSEVTCNGGAGHSVAAKQPSGSPRTTERDLRDYYAE